MKNGEVPALAAFLIELRRKSKKLPFFDPRQIFSLKDYIYKLIHEIDRYNHDIKTKLRMLPVFWKKILYQRMKNCLSRFVTAIIIR